MSKRFVITDIHGCAATFRKMVEEELRPSREDELFLLGDYIDRGPDSKGVLDFIFELRDEGYKVNCLRGNHEQFMLDAREDLDAFQHWVVYNGGETTLKSFGANTVKDIPERYLELVENLPYFFELQDFLMVHAGFNFKAEDPFEDKEAMLMIRNFWIDHEWLGKRRIIHGHTPSRISEIRANIDNHEAVEINLDAGCVYNTVPDMNKLVALEFNDWQLFVLDCVDEIK